MRTPATPQQRGLPSRSPLQKNAIVDKGLSIYLQTRRKKYALKWGIINTLILLILLLDISSKCPYACSKWYYAEYMFAGLFGFSVAYNFSRYFYFLFSFDPIRGTDEQRKLLQFNENGN